MRNIDGKFSTDGDRIFNTVSGEEIPADEPLFVLRARDELALKLLREYDLLAREANCNELHLGGIAQLITKFAQYKMSHPERMKQPGITRHLKLEPGVGRQ